MYFLSTIDRSSNKNFLAGPESRIYKLFPGVHYTADQQCEMKFGDGYRRAGFQNLEDVCRILKCEQQTGEALLVRNTHGYTAMEGTQCGRNKVRIKKPVLLLFTFALIVLIRLACG